MKNGPVRNCTCSSYCSSSQFETRWTLPFVHLTGNVVYKAVNADFFFVFLQESERKKQELEGNMKNLEKQLADSLRSQDDLKSEMQVLAGSSCHSLPLAIGVVSDTQNIHFVLNSKNFIIVFEFDVRFLYIQHNEIQIVSIV